MINRIQNKSFCLHNIRVCSVILYYVYFENIYMYLHVYIYIIYITNKYIKYKKNKIWNIYMHVYLYIHNKYTQYTHIYYVNKNFYFGCD